MECLSLSLSMFEGTLYNIPICTPVGCGLWGLQQCRVHIFVITCIHTHVMYTQQWCVHCTYIKYNLGLFHLSFCQSSSLDFFLLSLAHIHGCSASSASNHLVWGTLIRWCFTKVTADDQFTGQLNIAYSHTRTTKRGRKKKKAKRDIRVKKHFTRNK